MTCFIKIKVVFSLVSGHVFSGIRAFSTSKNDDSFFTDYIGLAIFDDADKEKLNILKYIKGKSGIYM